MSSPFIKIWIRPRETLRAIEGTRYLSWLVVLSLASLYGFYDVIQGYHPLFKDVVFFAKLFPTNQVGLMILNALIWGLIATSLESGIIFFLSRLLYGEASYRSVFQAITWSKLPILVDAILVWLPLILIFRQGAYMFGSSSGWENLLKIILMILSVIFNLWYIFIISQTITEINEYESVWQGFFVAFSGGFLYVILIFILILLFY